MNDTTPTKSILEKYSNSYAHSALFLYQYFLQYPPPDCRLNVYMQSNLMRDPDDDGGMVLRNVGILPLHYSVSQPRGRRLESLLIMLQL